VFLLVVAAYFLLAPERADESKPAVAPTAAAENAPDAGGQFS
jgi:hypothetical protein